MPRKKTHAEIVSKVEALVGDEYEVLGDYINSKTKITFRHSICEYEYGVRPNDFFKGVRCPKCSGLIKKTTQGFKEEVNALVGDEYEVLGNYSNAKTKITFKHSVCGNEYEVTPDSFLRGNRCPTCFGRNKKSTTVFKKEVKTIVGNEYEVLGDYTNSYTKINIKHSVCGNGYEVRPDLFLSGSRCPTCTDTQKSTSMFKEEVKALVGGEYEVLGNYSNTKTKITFKHSVCGNEYEVRPKDFLKGTRCPTCAGLIRKTNSVFQEEVKLLVGNEYVILGDYINARTKINIKHSVCENEYEVRPGLFLRGSRCPACNESKGEREVNNFLHKNKIESTREYTHLKCKDERQLRFDFAAKKGDKVIALIEYDGRQHYEPVKAWGGKSALREVQRRDAIKTKFCADNGIPLIRIPYWDFDNIDAILTEKLLPLLFKEDKRDAS